MQTHSTTVFVPYGKLRHSPRNVRTRDNKYNDGLVPLAASIEALGVLQNLIVSAHGRGKQMHYEVEGGQRRLDALGILFKNGVVTSRTPIPTIIVPVGDAVAISLAENVQREALHKGDEIVAFRTMIDGGKTIEEVATAFNVTPLVVQRRLKLANAAPRFLTMFRADEIGIDILMSLAITDDHERQAQVWDTLPKDSRDARSLRAALTKAQVDIKRNPIALYVGAKAYEEAGGAITRDLFSDKDDGYMLDAALLHQLAQVKLTKKADAIKKEGFAWVETRLYLDCADRDAFGQVSTIAREPTKKENKQITKLKEQIAALEASEDESDETFDTLDTLRDELTEIEESLEVPDPAQQAIAGAIVTVGHDGKAEVLRGLIRPEDKRAFKAGKKPKEQNAGGATDASENELSARLTLRLTAQLSAGLQLATARTPHVALALTVYRLVERFTASTREPVHLHLTRANLRMHDETIEESPAVKELQALRDRVLDQVPGDLLTWFLEQSTERLLEILAVCIAPAVDAVSNSAEMPAEIAALARATKLDMADYWEPKADTYLRFVPKPLIVASISECLSPEAGVEVSKAKTKALMVSTAETMLAGKRWLPSVMRPAKQS